MKKGAANARVLLNAFLALSALALFLLAAWTQRPLKYPDIMAVTYDLPAHFFIPDSPADNPTTVKAVELGRRLFYERRLSVNGTVSCADCHRQSLAFTDSRRFSTGATGELTRRNAMSLTNVVFNDRLTWADDRIDSLEAQAIIPLTHLEPLEMGLLENAATILESLAQNVQYLAMFREAFPATADPVTLDNIIRAIAAFQRTLISADSPYDRFLSGDRDALSAQARRGMALFESARVNCVGCHGGFNFRFTEGHRLDESDQSVAYHNTGLYNLDAAGSYPAEDQGLFEVTGQARDMGRFKAPTLRNVELTAPYMHDGSIASLKEVIDHYAAGGRSIEDGSNVGDGSRNPHKSELIAGFSISEVEESDLLAFLRSLTDQSFVTNPAFASPFDSQ